MKSIKQKGLMNKLDTGRLPKDDRPPQSKETRKHYSSPKFEYLGCISEETLGVGGSNDDTGQGDLTKRGNG